MVNIGIGLGLPWLLSVLSGHKVPVCGKEDLFIIAIFHTGGVALFFGLTFIMALVQRANKATLNKPKGILLLITYAGTIGGYVMYYYLS